MIAQTYATDRSVAVDDGYGTVSTDFARSPRLNALVHPHAGLAVALHATAPTMSSTFAPLLPSDSASQSVAAAASKSRGRGVAVPASVVSGGSEAEGSVGGGYGARRRETRHGDPLSLLAAKHSVESAWMMQRCARAVGVVDGLRLAHEHDRSGSRTSGMRFSAAMHARMSAAFASLFSATSAQALPSGGVGWRLANSAVIVQSAVWLPAQRRHLLLALGAAADAGHASDSSSDSLSMSSLSSSSSSSDSSDGERQGAADVEGAERSRRARGRIRDRMVEFLRLGSRTGGGVGAASGVDRAGPSTATYPTRHGEGEPAPGGGAVAVAVAGAVAGATTAASFSLQSDSAAGSESEDGSLRSQHADPASKHPVPLRARTRAWRCSADTFAAVARFAVALNRCAASHRNPQRGGASELLMQAAAFLVWVQRADVPASERAGAKVRRASCAWLLPVRCCYYYNYCNCCCCYC
jgi:hypothetical protein